MADESISTADLDKENRKDGDMASIQQLRIDTAKGWSAEQAAGRANIDLNYHTALDEGGGKREAQALRGDMAINARESGAYRDALEAAAPALIQQIQKEAAEALEERKRREALAAASGLSEDSQADAGDSDQLSDSAYIKRDAERAARWDEAATIIKEQGGAVAEPVTPEKPLGGKSEAVASEVEKPEVEKERERREAAAAAAATAAALASPATSKAAERSDDKEENSVDVQRKGAELERGEFIVPRRITQAYTEHEGKFFAKDTSRMMFHDQGEKLATSTTDKAAISDMVAYAKAKQWESLKLTGSQEFRREAWLQAESQGIKTQGFTPREKDLIELKTLTMERSTNSITPLQDRAKDRAPLEKPVAAPRHDLNKNQAATASAAAQNSTTNIKALQKDPAMERFSMEDLAKIAFYRALIVEREKDSPEAVRDEAIAKFDKTMRDPAMVKALPDPEIKAEQGAKKEKEHKRDTPELSL